MLRPILPPQMLNAPSDAWQSRQVDDQIIDAHVHVWELARGDYEWITPELGPLFRDFSLDDLEQALGASTVSRVVLIQCAPSEAETEFLLGIAEAAKQWVAGVVGWTDFESPNAPERIDALSKRKCLVGLRPMVQNIPDTTWMLQRMLSPAFEAVSQSQLCFDALVQPRHLPVLLELLERHSELKVVIDHCAKPDIHSGELEPWATQIREIALATNVFCKLSGLVTEAGMAWEASHLRPYVDVLCDAFGEDRLIWGSDWPVVNYNANYSAWLSVAAELTAGMGAVARKKILSANAVRFYGLDHIKEGVRSDE